MPLWRISRFHDLQGLGGLRAPGRWHHRGHPVVYLAESAAGALLEVCAHTAANDVSPQMSMLRIDVPHDLPMETVALTSLPSGWSMDPNITRAIGSAWLERAATPLLRVPSVIAPETWNVLLNPAAAGAALVKIEEIYRFPFDSRLKL